MKEKGADGNGEREGKGDPGVRELSLETTVTFSSPCDLGLPYLNHFRVCAGRVRSYAAFSYRGGAWRPDPSF